MAQLAPLDETSVLSIETLPYASVQAELRLALERDANEAFGDVDLVRNTQWSLPTWTYIARRGDQPVAHYNLIRREIRLDGRPIRAAGLNNLIAAPNERGCGQGRRLLEQTQDQWFSRYDVQLGLLLCSDALVGFYARLGWRPTTAQVVYEQPTGRCRWPARCMLYVPSGIREPASIDLQGLPW